MIHEHDAVVLTRSLPEHGLTVGDVGAVVATYGPGHAFEVEFVSGNGQTIALVTLEANDVRPLGTTEILHARDFSARA